MRLLMVPGIGGSDAGHWQSLWQAASPGTTDRIEPASWDYPDQDDWLAAIERKAGADTVLVAHSLGCLAAATWLARRPATVAGVVMVAPPDHARPAFPRAALSFAQTREELTAPVVVVASSDDPYGGEGFAAGLARDWGGEFVDAGPLGHINSESGVGDWPAGRRELDRFVGALTAVDAATPAGVEFGDIRIAVEAPRAADVLSHLEQHLSDMFLTSPAESVHALPAEGLTAPSVTFWTARNLDGTLLGCGALNQINSAVGEVKSMRTTEAARGSGVGAAVLRTIVGEARQRGIRFLYLETGSQDYFAPARRLYARAGFEETVPFAGYRPDPASVYMRLRL